MVFSILPSFPFSLSDNITYFNFFADGEDSLKSPKTEKFRDLVSKQSTSSAMH